VETVFLCNFLGAPYLYHTGGQAWAEGKGELATLLPCADCGLRTGNGHFVRRHDLSGLHVSIDKAFKPGS